MLQVREAMHQDVPSESDFKNAGLMGLMNAGWIGVDVLAGMGVGPIPSWKPGLA